MSTTLTEAAKYTVNMVKKGVLMEIVKDSVVMTRLPFIDVVGNAYQYLRETTLPTAQFYAPNAVWSESTGDTTQKTASITILGGDADLDEFLRRTRGDKTDLEAETIQQKAKAVKHTFLDRFWYGDDANANEFSGVHDIFLGSDFTNQQVHEGSAGTGTALNATNVDLAYDLVLDGKPDVIITNRNIRRRWSQYLRLKSNVDETKDSFGNPVKAWNQTPIEYDDFLTQTETITGTTYSAKTGGATGTVFFLRFGTMDLVGLQNGGLDIINIGQLETKDAKRHRIRWYVGLAAMRVCSMALIDGITDVAMAD